MTSSDLLDLFVRTLQRNAGGSLHRWRMIVGEVRIYDRATHPHCNWSIWPHGTARENAAVESLADRLRGTHSIVTE